MLLPYVVQMAVADNPQILIVDGHRLYCNANDRIIAVEPGRRVPLVGIGDTKTTTWPIE